MKKFFGRVLLVSSVCLPVVFASSSVSFAQQAHYPIVKGHGGVYKIQEATAFPDPRLHYKIIVDIKEGASGNKAVNGALNNLARLANLHGLGGVTPEHLDIVAVVHGEATVALLSDVSYENRFGVLNPNTDLINSLLEAGIKIFVCGQSLNARKYDARELTTGVQISISAVTMLTTYQLNGYALISY